MPEERTVTSTGSAVASVVPDRAALSVGVQVDAASASEALAVAAQRAAALLGALRDGGVADELLHTSGVGLWQDQHAGVFRASHTVDAAVPVAAAGPLLDACARATGDHFTLQHVTLVVSDPEPHLAALRPLAVAEARARAAAIAAAEGCRVGAPLRMEEGGGGPIPMGFATAARAAPSMPIAAGSQTLSVMVTVTYELLDG